MLLDYNSSRVEKFDSSGTFVSSFDTTANGHTGVGYGSAIALDSSGDIFVTDYQQSIVQEYDSSGTFVTQFGNDGNPDDLISNPTALGFDSNGNLYVITTDGSGEVEKFISFADPGSYSLNVSALTCENNIPLSIFCNK